MVEAAVLYEVKDQIAQITLNRPENRNSMTEDVLEGLREAVGEVRQDRDLRCVVITGRGRSFCAGADFKSQVQRGESAAGQLPHERSFAMYSPFLSVLEIEIPTIAALFTSGVIILSGDVRFTPESGHSEGSREMSAYDPKRTFVGLCDSAGGPGNAWYLQY